jgi:hypothetical protein
MKLITPNILKAMMVVGGLIVLVVVFSYIIFPDVICKSALANAKNEEPSSNRTNIDPIVETCRGASTVLPR